MMSFFRNLVGVKTDQAVNSAVEAIVRWDPQSATEAELRTMESNLDQLGQQVAQARMAYDRERKEADAIQSLSRQRMAAAEQRQGRLEAEARPAWPRAPERKKADAIQSLSRQRMAAAEQLQGRMEAEADPARKAELERS